MDTPSSGGCGIILGFILGMLVAVLLVVALVPQEPETTFSEPTPNIIVVTSVAPAIQVTVEPVTAIFIEATPNIIVVTMVPQ
jgi:hypothetical protein